MKKTLGIVATAILLFALAACQTAKPVPEHTARPEPVPAASPTPSMAVSTIAIAPNQSIIRTEALGFSPTADFGDTSIDFALLFANADSVKSWKVAMTNEKGTQKTFDGTGSALPTTLTWDGKNDSGVLAPQGAYTANLSVKYNKDYTPGSAQSTSFILDNKKPTGKITLSPELFSPMDAKDTLNISISTDPSPARIISWTMDIYDPGMNLFRSFSGKWPTNSVAWDGKGIDGDLVVSAEDYSVVVKFRDEFGNVGTIESSIPIDILVIKDGNGYRIENSRIYFQDFTANYRSVPAALAKRNLARLDQLAVKLNKYPDYKIKIVGHAVMVYWDNKALGRTEQENVLVPLSKARADAIKQAMIDRGVKASMIEAVGVGAADPLVPDSDYADRWRNRRTAIFLMN